MCWKLDPQGGDVKRKLLRGLVEVVRCSLGMLLSEWIKMVLMGIPL
jgi:hypothetical protein